MAEKLDLPEGLTLSIWDIEGVPYSYVRYFPESALLIYTNGRVYVQLGKQKQRIAAFLADRVGFADPAAEGKEASEIITRCFAAHAKRGDMAQYRLKFFSDVEEGYYAVRDSGGPTSCMSHDASDYRCGYTPVRFYNWEVNKRVQLAALFYIPENRYVARALVDLRDGQVSRTFFTSRTARVLFESALETAGFELTDGIYGVQFVTKRRTKDDVKYLVLPYLDRGFFWYSEARGVETIRADGEHGMVDEYLLDSRNTSGLIYRGRTERCAYCDEVHTMDEMFSEQNLIGGQYEGRHICESCGNEYFRATDDGIYYMTDELAWSSRYSRWLLRDTSIYSSVLGEWLPGDEARVIQIMVSDGYQARQVYVDHVTVEMATGQDNNGLQRAVRDMAHFVRVAA